MSRTRVKICGVRRPEDAMAAADAGADAVGVVVYAPGAKREVSEVQADHIFSALPLFVSTVGVVVGVHPNRLRMIMAQARFDLAQYHGNESIDDVKKAQPTPVVKAVRTNGSLAADVGKWLDPSIRNLRAITIDSAGDGGSGQAADWDEVEQAIGSIGRDKLPPLILAGGLTPDNVGEIVTRFRPWAVDVSSGVEGEDGFKSPEKMRAFIDAVRAADG